MAISWPAIVYAETHAGAGIYHQNGQNAPKNYIESLHDLVSKTARQPPGAGSAGFEYFAGLEPWWCQTHPWKALSLDNSYPGSVVLAATFLTKQMKSPLRSE